MECLRSSTMHQCRWHVPAAASHRAHCWVHPRQGGTPGAQRRSAAAPSSLAVRAESKEYYDYKDMPPLPLTVTRIHIPDLDYTVVDKGCEATRLASLAIFYDLYKDSQYQQRLNRKSAITALCMFDRDDVSEAERTPGSFPNIELLHRVYNQGLNVKFVVEEVVPQ